MNGSQSQIDNDGDIRLVPPPVKWRKFKVRLRYVGRIPPMIRLPEEYMETDDSSVTAFTSPGDSQE